MTTTDEARTDRWTIALLAGGLWLLVDVLRVWTPSLITIFGRAAETPAELIGAFALACGAAPLLLLLLPRVGRSEPTALLVLVAARLALLLTDGDRPQLVVASLGTAAGLWWLALACSRAGARLVPGLAWGLLLATTSHAALGTYGAVWRRDAFGVVEALVAVTLALLALRTRVEAPAPWVGGRPGW